ncbi:hypothetical protein CK203_112824 [Vitis vinifera]|uniref:Uncharacterized protein n=1 Tax=Vitis vinifera TaxID=29760 RepID=A0A438F7T9_VITVI|nr:hypothetical protein CK203_112824 [Vitis vinifera]
MTPSRHAVAPAVAGRTPAKSAAVSPLAFPTGSVCGGSVKLAVNNRVSLQNTIEMLLDALGPSTFKAGSSCLYWNAILQYMVYYWGLLQACLFEFVSIFDMMVMATSNSDGDANGSTCIPPGYGTYIPRIDRTVLAGAISDIIQLCGLCRGWWARIWSTAGVGVLSLSGAMALAQQSNGRT